MNYFNDFVLPSPLNATACLQGEDTLHGDCHVSSSCVDEKKTEFKSLSGRGRRYRISP